MYVVHMLDQLEQFSILFSSYNNSWTPLPILAISLNIISDITFVMPYTMNETYINTL